MIALGIFEQDDRTLGGYKEIASRVAQKITEHVARASRISLVERVEQQDSAIFRALHPAAQPGQALAAELDGIYGGGLAVRKPHAVRGIVTHRVSHRFPEIDLIDIVGIENDDAHRSPLLFESFVPEVDCKPRTNRKMCGVSRGMCSYRRRVLPGVMPCTVR